MSVSTSDPNLVILSSASSGEIKKGKVTNMRKRVKRVGLVAVAFVLAVYAVYAFFSTPAEQQQDTNAAGYSSLSHKLGRSPDGSTSKHHASRSKSESSAPGYTNGQSSSDYMYEHYSVDKLTKDSSKADEDEDYNSFEPAQSELQSSEVTEEEDVVQSPGQQQQQQHSQHKHHRQHHQAESKCYKTFFSTMSITFKDVELETDGSIPVKLYLDACRAILPIFDKLSSTAFSPVKMDIDGNIKKINQKYITDPERFRTIQSIALTEQRAQQNHLSSSATTAILWLKRAIEFIREFLAEILSGKPDLSECANIAYAKTLRPFHGWVVRGVFGVAVRSLPYRKDFLSHLAVSAEDYEKEDFMSCLMKNMEEYVADQDTVLKAMNEFLLKNDLDNNEQV